ncbi:MAG: ATP-binding cassette domain-containing protein [Desulfonauticus sp.]|nr:ATP-binding cassette domain-containing protein [Desulfonauticus sp.]
MLKVQHLNLSYGSQQVLFDLNFSLNQGEILGFLGPNGAGKSSTMRILTGYLKPSSGQVLFLDKDISEDPIFLRKHLGYLPETAPLYPELKVAEYLSWVAELKGIVKNTSQEVDKVISECGLSKVKAKLIGYLSKGYRQRVGLAQALLGNPKLIILDEPTVGLDPAQVREIRDLIKKLGQEKTILLSTHILSEVELLCKRVIIINQGRILADEDLENLLKKVEKTLYVLLVAGEVDLEKLKLDLTNQCEIHKIYKVEDGHILEISPKTKNDIRSFVFDTVVKNNGILLEFYPKRSSLEEVFVKMIYRGEVH